MKSAKCENCGAGVTPGAVSCPYCGSTFTAAAPGAPAAAPNVDPEVARLLRANQKIQAIKVYREGRKCSLAQAKDAVDAIERSLGITH